MGSEFENLPDKCCAKCHFLCITHRNIDLVRARTKMLSKVGAGPIELPESITHSIVGIQKREALLTKDGSVRLLEKPGLLRCYKNVWDAKNWPDGETPDISAVVAKHRGETCFFYPYAPGTFFPTAAELERRETERREARRHRTADLRIAIVAAAIGACATLLGVWITRDHPAPPPVEVDQNTQTSQPPR